MTTYHLERSTGLSFVYVRGCTFYSLFENTIVTHSQTTYKTASLSETKGLDELCCRGRLGELMACCPKPSIPTTDLMLLGIYES